MKATKFKKIMLLLLVATIISLVLTGCEVSESEKSPVETSLPSMDTINGSTLELEHDIEGITFKTSYNTGNYKFNTWRITDSKTIRMTASVGDVPEGTEIFIEHVHVYMSLKSISPQLDSLIQDSMDDKYHGTTQDGFYVSEQYPYENIFAVEGFSKDIINGWSFYCGDYGSGSMSTSRLTEDNLIKNGTYANKLTVVYDVLIKHKDEEHYHIKSVADEFLIPIPSSILNDRLEDK